MKLFTFIALPFITLFSSPLKQQEVTSISPISEDNSTQEVVDSTIISQEEENVDETTTEDESFHFIDQQGLEELIFLIFTFLSSGGGIALVELLLHHKMKKQLKNINEAYEKMDKQMELLENKYSSVLNENIDSTQKVLETMNAIQPMIENLNAIRSSLKDVVSSNPNYVKNGKAHDFVKTMNEEEKTYGQKQEEDKKS